MEKSLLENQKVIQSVKKFLTFYGTGRFITVFTRSFHWSLYQARCILHPVYTFPPCAVKNRSIRCKFSATR